MIRRPIEPLKMLFVLQGSYFKRLIVPQVLLFIFSFLIYFYQTHIATKPVPLNPSVFAILGISLAIFHGFCNNAAYDRFWEGRKLWGTLVWLSRNIARQVLTLPNVSMAEKQAFIRHQIAFVHSLRQQLRGEDNTANLQRLLTVEEQQAVVGQDFMALNEIVDEISEPFGTGENELPLGMMCDTIETQLAMLSHQQFAPEQKPRVPANVVI